MGGYVRNGRARKELPHGHWGELEKLKVFSSLSEFPMFADILVSSIKATRRVDSVYLGQCSVGPT